MTRKRNRGLGDTVEKFTEATGIKKVVEKITPNCGCNERRDKLNELFPYRLKPRCMNELEYNQWGEFKEVRTLTISKEQVEFIAKMYSDIFNVPIFIPCASCSPKPLINMIDKLDKVYENY